MSRKAPAPRPHGCQQWRRKLVKSGTLDTIRGEVLIGSIAWREERCGTPLFSDEERESGRCRSCRDGWTHEHNYPIDAPAEAANS